MAASITLASGQNIKGISLSITRSSPTGPTGNYGGTLDLSYFPNLTGVFATGIGLTALGPGGFSSNRILTTVYVSSNSITGALPSLYTNTGIKIAIFSSNNFTGSIPDFSGNANKNLNNYLCDNNNLSGAIPILTGLTALVYFGCGFNSGIVNGNLNSGITGAIPDLSRNASLQNFFCNNNSITGPIPPLTGNPALVSAYFHFNQITGTIPNLNNNTALQNFNCYYNNLTGPIPDLTGLSKLKTFQCYANNLTGTIPSLTQNTGIITFSCGANYISGLIPDLSSNTIMTTFASYNNTGVTGYAGGIFSSTLKNFQSQNCSLSQTAVDAILLGFVNAGATNGVLQLGGLNNSPPSSDGYNNKSILQGRNWTVTTR